MPCVFISPATLIKGVSREHAPTRSTLAAFSTPRCLVISPLLAQRG